MSASRWRQVICSDLHTTSPLSLFCLPCFSTSSPVIHKKRWETLMLLIPVVLGTARCFVLRQPGTDCRVVQQRVGKRRENIYFFFCYFSCCKIVKRLREHCLSKMTACHNPAVSNYRCMLLISWTDCNLACFIQSVDERLGKQETRRCGGSREDELERLCLSCRLNSEATRMRVLSLGSIFHGGAQLEFTMRVDVTRCQVGG